MTVGRRPKTTEQKRRLGNPGGRPLPVPLTVLPQTTAIPEPSRPLGRYGEELWTQIWTYASAWVSGRTDVELVLLVCEQADERAQLRLRVLREQNWRDRAALRSLEDQLVKNLSMLGLTPTDRARLGLAEVKAASKLEAMRARQAERMAAQVVDADNAG